MVPRLLFLSLLFWSISEGVVAPKMARGSDKEQVLFRTLLDEVRAAHKKIRSEVFMSVQVGITETSSQYFVHNNETAANVVTRAYNKQGDLILVKQKLPELHVENDQNSQILCANDKYRFHIIGSENSWKIAFLEASNQTSGPSQKQQQTETLKLFKSISMAGLYLIDCLDSSGFELQNCRQEKKGSSNRYIINGRLSLPEYVLEEIEFSLDANNFFQLLSMTAKSVELVHRKGETTAISTSYDYGDVSFSEIKPLRKVETLSSNARGTSNVVIEYKDWQANNLQTSRFYLAGYGLPEPDMAALSVADGGLNWTRIVLWGVIAATSTTLIWFARKKRG
jgi:hypothetical protein